ARAGHRDVAPADKAPTKPPPKVVRTPPFWMVKLPTPTRPTTRDSAVARGFASTTVGLFRVSMVALVTAVGTPPVQLGALNQSEDISPVQLVWARVDTVDAASNANTAVVVSKCVRIERPPG